MATLSDAGVLPQVLPRGRVDLLIADPRICKQSLADPRISNAHPRPCWRTQGIVGAPMTFLVVITLRASSGTGSARLSAPAAEMFQMPSSWHFEDYEFD